MPRLDSWNVFVVARNELVCTMVGAAVAATVVVFITFGTKEQIKSNLFIFEYGVAWKMNSHVYMLLDKNPTR